ncbi:MAG: carbamoyltransferase HypF [Geobacteraceae bacterium]|nr:carbamoyltransferase HypF [Geobacteraceae bacterium]
MSLTRRHYNISGIVQGVGFRPFVYRLAHELDLSGWTRNTPAGVEIEVQGATERLAVFSQRLSSEAPPLAVITAITVQEMQGNEERGFTIRPSADGEPDIRIAPDSALCNDCLRELFDPDDRRYHYPFITCTNCGPRYSIITGTPYDRPRTTMAGFPLCPACQKEYHDPSDRRFHAQPLACATCGPRLRLLDNAGNAHSLQTTAPGTADENAAIIARAIGLLKTGAILAIKGIGGFHLAVDACNNDAVQRLRLRKKRDEKPFAIMAANLATARRITELTDIEERLLASTESPIVIVRKSADCPVSPLVAPDNGWLGLMLPYTPIHHLLLRLGNFTALVMTSANRSDDPIAFEEGDALRRLSGIADFFLSHDRPIHIRCDDSVIRVFQGRPLFYRRSRGYAPRAIQLPFEVQPILGVGAEMKNAICLANGRQAFLSQYIGDLQNESTYDSFRHIITHLSGLLQISAEGVACDSHPDYLSSIHAVESGLQLTRVQHHHAHLAACMADNGLTGEVIGIIYDGTGYGTDGTIWGGEFLVGGYDGFLRAGHFKPVRMPGSDAAVREPWRIALAYLYLAYGQGARTLDHPIVSQLSAAEHDIFAGMLDKGLNSPLTSSCGRLFDAVAAILNVRQHVSYDGQAAIELEALAEAAGSGEPFPCTIIPCAQGPIQIDFTPLFPVLLSAQQSGVAPATLAYRFHATVARATIEAGEHIARASGRDRIVLSGGVFQNRLLTEMVYTGLTKSGLQVFTHRVTPPNDGCIALGQVAIAGWQTRRNI